MIFFFIFSQIFAIIVISFHDWPDAGSRVVENIYKKIRE